MFLNEFFQSFLFEYWRRVNSANKILCILLQIVLEIIEIIRKNFSFEFTEDVSEFVVLGRNIRKVKSGLYKVYRACLDFWEVKTDLEITKT